MFPISLEPPSHAAPTVWEVFVKFNVAALVTGVPALNENDKIFVELLYDITAIKVVLFAGAVPLTILG
jgi:hypothetical protein